MKSAILHSLVGALCLCHLAPADVTMRSKMDYRMGSFVPAAAAEAANKQMGDMLANGITLRIKGKRSSMSYGLLVTIVDSEKGTITLLDPKGKRYATTSVSDFADKVKAAMPQIPEAARQMLENIKLDVKTDKTGKTDTIKGIKCEELVTNVSMDMPGPMAAAMSMKMEMHMWAAMPDELARVPALKEIAAYMTNQASGMDPTATASKMFGQLPGFGEKLKGPMQEMMKSSSQAVLRTEIKMIMPGSAKMMGASNPDEPMMNMTTDVTELSTDPVPDSAFQVPAGYQETKIEDLVQMMNPTKPGQPAPQGQPPRPPAAAAPSPAGVYRVGGGVTAPRLIRKVEPEFPEQDRRAQVQGTVTLYVQVGPEGKAENMRVLHSISPGLDAAAMGAVSQWQFEPGKKDGKPVRVESQIEVNFRFQDNKEGDVPSELAKVASVGGYPATSIGPVLIKKIEPEFTAEARAAKFQGTVTVSAIIGADGVPGDIRLVHSLGMGLDEKAIEAVKQWRFRPATKDGKPVAMMSMIEVNFRL
jgi:TonB family protein